METEQAINFVFAQLTTIFGWMTIINIVLLSVSAVLILLMRRWICRFHGRLFDLEAGQISGILYRFLGTYKILIFVFNLVPWLALRIVTSA